MGALELAELATNLLEELPGGETDGKQNAEAALRAALKEFYSDLTHQAIQRRNEALGQAFDMAWEVNNAVDVWKQDRQYAVRSEGEFLAMTRNGWYFVAQVSIP